MHTSNMEVVSLDHAQKNEEFTLTNSVSENGAPQRTILRQGNKGETTKNTYMNSSSFSLSFLSLVPLS